MLIGNNIVHFSCISLFKTFNDAALHLKGYLNI